MHEGDEDFECGYDVPYDWPLYSIEGDPVSHSSRHLELGTHWIAGEWNPFLRLTNGKKEHMDLSLRPFVFFFYTLLFVERKPPKHTHVNKSSVCTPVYTFFKLVG